MTKLPRGTSGKGAGWRPFGEVEAGYHVIVRKRTAARSTRSTFHRSLARATRKQIWVNTVRYTRLAAPRPNMLPVPTTFLPTSGGKSADTEGCVSGVDSSSLSVAGRSHFVGIGDTTQEQRAQTLPCKFGDPTAAITHLDTSLLQLPATREPGAKTPAPHRGRAGGVSSPSDQGRQPCSQTSGRQDATTRRSHPRP